MKYSVIKKYDIANGPGVRITLFVSGCTHHCRGCFQPETWSFDYGEEFTPAVEDEIIRALSNKSVQGLTLLGGEPFEPDNQRGLMPLLRCIRAELPDKDIWAFSGYLFDELKGDIEGSGRARCEVTDEMLSLVDVLVDGEFHLEEKDITLQFRGSRNQRLIDVKKSLTAGTVVWWQA